ncbi:MAG: hypothetical protein AB7P23_12430, partial [Amphiplicatus sp.]
MWSSPLLQGRSGGPSFATRAFGPLLRMRLVRWCSKQSLILRRRASAVTKDGPRALAIAAISAAKSP